MTHFDTDSPVFTDPEVAEHFLSCINNQIKTEANELLPSDVWKWLRTPPVQTVIR